MQSWMRDARSSHEGEGRMSPVHKVTSPPTTTYSPPDKKTRRMSGFKPIDCNEHEVISNLSTREAYRRIEAHINEVPSLNTGTIEANNQVKLWKATGLPVKLTKTTENTIFFHSVELDLDY